MCTVTWLQDDEGYELLCNRDERHTRKPAAPPAVRIHNGVRILAPADGDFGGTWIAVNELGVACCLLNRYQPAATARGGESRGLLVAELADSRSVAELLERVGKIEVDRYQPFTLVALEPGRPILKIESSSGARSVKLDTAPETPLLSSSYEPERVAAWRRQLFGQFGTAWNRVDRNMLLAFHRSHAPEASAFSPCMHRPDASTVSFSSIRVGGELIEFEYVAGAPCSPAATNPVRISMTLNR